MHHVIVPHALTLLLFVAVAGGGCGKDESLTSEAAPAKIQTVPTLAPPGEDLPPVPVTGPGATAAPVVTTSAVSPDEVDEDGKNVMLEALNSAMRGYVKDNETVPQSLKELVEAGYLPRVPSPPAGKRYSIERSSGAVILVNN